MTFSEQIIYAMFKPDKYKEILSLGKKRHVSFIIVMMLVLGIVTFAVPMGAFVASFGGFETLFSEKLGDISFKDGELSLDKPFKMSIDYYTILIDTSVDEIPNEMLTKDGVAMAIGKKNARLVYCFNGTYSDYQKIDLNLIVPEGLNNDMLVRLVPAIYAYLVMAFIVQCGSMFIKYSIISIVLSLLINSYNRAGNLQLTFGQRYLIAFYGQTFGYILSNFNAALGLLPGGIVSIIAIFISIGMITKALMLMDPRNNV